MNLKLRFSIGIIFSVTLHFFLIIWIFSLYPGITNNGDWGWANLIQFPNKKNINYNDLDRAKIKFSEKLSVREIFFPDIVLIKEKEKNIIFKKNIKPQISLKNILDQVEKFPQSLNIEESSNKKLSGKVGELLNILAPVRLQNETSKKRRLNLNFNELKQFRNSLEDFLYKRWEVPIHLRESNYKAFVELEIESNGRLLNWEIKDSSNI